MKKYVSILAVLVLLAGCLIITPTSAKDFNVADNQSITYYSGGEGYLAIPAGALYTNSPATTIKISFDDVVEGTLGGGNNIGISILFGTSYIPLAYFVTSRDPQSAADVVAFLKVLLTGFPASIIPGNSRTVDQNVVVVERHGNSITAKLTEQQTIKWATAPGKAVTATIPAFTIELSKVGGDAQIHKIIPLSGYTGASGYTQQVDKIGFSAVGTITTTSTGVWQSENQAMTDCFITMHGITTYTAP